MSNSSAPPANAAISIRPTLASSKWLDAACPKCQKPMALGEQVVLCPKCYAPQHLPCWRDNDNTCAIDQTPARVIERPGRPAGAGAAPAQAAAPVVAPAAAAAGAAAAPARAPAAVAVATVVSASRPDELADPWKYALAMNATPVSDVWRRNIMTIAVMIFIWAIIIAVAYALGLIGA